MKERPQRTSRRSASMRLVIVLTTVTCLGSIVNGSVVAQPIDVAEIIERLMEVCKSGDSGYGVNSRMYGAWLQGNVTDGNNNSCDLSTDDYVDSLLIISRREPSLVLRFNGGTPDELRMWGEENKEAIFNALFPNSISESAGGRAASRLRSQQFFLEKVLAYEERLVDNELREYKIGGLIESEKFEVDSVSGSAVQSSIRLEAYNLSLMFRGAAANDGFNTQSLMAGADYTFPSFFDFQSGSRDSGRKRHGIMLSVFVNGFGVYSDLLTAAYFQPGASLWAFYTEHYPDLGLSWRIGVSGEASKDIAPIVPSDLQFIADGITSRGLDFNANAGFRVRGRFGFFHPIVRILLNSSTETSTGSTWLTQWVVSIGLGIRFSDDVTLTPGARWDFGLEGVSANSIFLALSADWGRP